MPHQTRAQKAIEIATLAGPRAVEFFNRAGTLEIEDKGPQDFVSEADKAIEQIIRAEIAKSFPEDGVVGEEYGATLSERGYTWVIDPIDGTTNFIHGIPAWTIVIALVKDDKTQAGVIHDPIHNETFAAIRGQGATLNNAPIKCTQNARLSRGTVGTGYSNRVSTDGIKQLLSLMFDHGAMYHRNASGALSLAYVGAGRLLGYLEEHMNAWDCLAGQLIVQEAGGRIEEQSANDMIKNGGRVVVGAPDVFEQLTNLANTAFAPH